MAAIDLTTATIVTDADTGALTVTTSSIDYDETVSPNCYVYLGVPLPEMLTDWALDFTITAETPPTDLATFFYADIVSEMFDRSTGVVPVPNLTLFQAPLMFDSVQTPSTLYAPMQCRIANDPAWGSVCDPATNPTFTISDGTGSLTETIVDNGWFDINAVVNMDGDPGYVKLDAGADFFGNFIHRVSWQSTADYTSLPNGTVMEFYRLNNSGSANTSDTSGIGFGVKKVTDGSTAKVQLVGSDLTTTIGDPFIGSPYVDIVRDGTSLEVTVYADYDRMTLLVPTTTLTVSSDSYQYWFLHRTSTGSTPSATFTATVTRWITDPSPVDPTEVFIDGNQTEFGGGDFPVVGTTPGTFYFRLERVSSDNPAVSADQQIMNQCGGTLPDPPSTLQAVRLKLFTDAERLTPAQWNGTNTDPFVLYSGPLAGVDMPSGVFQLSLTAGACCGGWVLSDVAFETSGATGTTVSAGVEQVTVATLEPLVSVTFRPVYPRRA